MADQEDAPIEGAQAEAGPEEVTGAEANTEEVPEQEPVDVLEIDDELGAKHVRIMVDGKEELVPLRELREGHMRLKDYTQKTQSVAEQRKEAEAAIQLQRAFQSNPGLTVQILAERSGLSVQEFLGLSSQQQNAVAQQAQEVTYDDPLEAALAEQQRRVAQLEQQMLQERADRELTEILGGMKRQYQASDEDLRAAAEIAMRNNMPPTMLPLIYESLAYRKGQTQQQVRQETTEQQAQAEQARRAAAAAAGGVIGAGTGATGTTTEIASDGRMTLQEAIDAALQGFPD